MVIYTNEHQILSDLNKCFKNDLKEIDVDLYELIIEGKEDENCIKKIIVKANEYEKILKKIYFHFKINNNLYIEWFENFNLY